MFVGIIFIPITIILIILLYYNINNIRFLLPLILITITSLYITYKIIQAFTKNNNNHQALIRLIILIITFIVLWCNEHDIISTDFGIEKNLNYINNDLFTKTIYKRI